MIDRFVLAPTYSYALHWELPSALTGLTAEFGMGSGVTLSLEAPGQNDLWCVSKARASPRPHSH